MWNGAEAYLEMWERADGVPTPGCHAPTARSPRAAAGALRLGADWQTLLRRAGQPQQRDRAWSWCVRGRGNARTPPTSPSSSTAGKVELVGSTARGRRGRRRARSASRRVRRPALGGGGVRLRRRAASAWVYAVRGGRVRAVGVATSRAWRAAIAGAARRDARLLAAKATRAKREFVPSDAQAATRGAARPAGRSPARAIPSSTPRLRSSATCTCRERRTDVPAVAA